MLNKVEHTQARLADEGARAVVGLLRYRILWSLSRPEARELTRAIATKPLPPAVRTVRTFGVRLEAIEALLAEGAVADVAAMADGLVESAPEEHLACVLLLKARAMFALAQTREDWLRAALPAMRVVIHFREKPEAAEALLLAGAAHEKCGLLAGAARLARECLRRDGLTTADERRARELLGRVTTPRGE